MSEQLMSVGETCQKLGISRSSLWRLRTGEDFNFPDPVELPTGSLRWRASQVDLWISSLPAGDNGMEQVSQDPAA